MIIYYCIYCWLNLLTNYMNVITFVLKISLHPSHCVGQLNVVVGFRLGLCESLNWGWEFGVGFLGGFKDHGVLIEVIYLKSTFLNYSFTLDNTWSTLQQEFKQSNPAPYHHHAKRAPCPHSPPTPQQQPHDYSPSQ